MKYDYLVVGAGLYGSVFAHEAATRGKRVLVVDKRPNIAGNVYTEDIEGIHVHKYGAHIFHTNNKKVWNYITQFAEFNRFTNSPVANYKGELYSLPFNMYTFNKMWGVVTPEQAEEKIEEQKKEAGIKEPANLEEQAISLVGTDIYEKLIKGYTEKQWGRPCTELPAFIIRRLPVRLVFDNNYFNDKYQGIPIGGYNRLIDGLLGDTPVVCEQDFFAPISPALAALCPKLLEEVTQQTDRTLANHWRKIASKLVYTGALDEFYGKRLGALDWRTVSFQTRIEDTPNFQGNAVVNYTSHDEPYTRIIEHKHFEMFGAEVYECPRTVVSEEYSTEYREGMEPYYPVNDERNNRLAEQYRQLAAQEEDVLFGGRLAEYKYYDMAPIVEQALAVKL